MFNFIIDSYYQKLHTSHWRFSLPMPDSHARWFFPRESFPCHKISWKKLYTLIVHWKVSGFWEITFTQYLYIYILDNQVRNFKFTVSSSPRLIYVQFSTKFIQVSRKGFPNIQLLDSFNHIHYYELTKLLLA